jgi:hypothetical protein
VVVWVNAGQQLPSAETTLQRALEQP